MPAWPLDVLNRHFDNRRAVPRRQGRDEAMHLAIKPNLLDRLFAIYFESRPEVVNVNARQTGHHPVCGTRGQTPQQEVIDSVFSPAAYDVASSLLERCDHFGNVGWVVLQITIH